MDVLIVIPTYNEVENIAKMLPVLRATVPSTHILVVDDASPDGTAQVVEEFASTDDHVHLLSRKAKGGLGGAYRAGFRWGIEHGYDHFVEMDADFSHDPKDLPRLFAEAEKGAGLVIGSRYVAGGVIPNWPWYREMLSRGGNLYASTLLRLKVRDATAGYRVYALDALRAIDFEGVDLNGYGFQIDMTDRARQAGVSIVEVPITFTDRVVGESKMSGSIITEALWMVTKRAVRRGFGRQNSPQGKVSTR